MDAIPAILKEPIFEKAFDVATLSNMEKNDYILYQISKSKKYDMELLADEAEERGMERGMELGMEKKDTKNILTIHSKGYTPMQISDLLDIPIGKVVDVLQKHGLIEPN